MSTDDGNLWDALFHRRLYYEKEREKDVYTITTVDLSGIYQSRTARFPSGFCLAGDARGFSGSAVLCGSGNYDYFRRNHLFQFDV